jgi:hypothetical protein
MTERPRYFRSGDEADTELTERIKTAERGFIPRVYMPVTPEDSDGMPFTFLDGNVNPGGYNTPYAFEEHNFEMRGNWFNHTTCIEGLPHPITGRPMACPICRSRVIPANQKRPYTAHAYTVINHTPYMVKEELKNPNGDEITLLIAKTKFAGKLRRKRRQVAQEGGLRGWKGLFIRSEKGEPSTGGEVEWVGKVELPDNLQPFDYSQILAPKTPEEIIRYLILGNMADPVDSGSTRVNARIGEGTDQIPF